MVWRNPLRLVPFLLGAFLFVGLAVMSSFPETIDSTG